jgi:hypothetical protein
VRCEHRLQSGIDSAGKWTPQELGELFNTTKSTPEYSPVTLAIILHSHIDSAEFILIISHKIHGKYSLNSIPGPCGVI